MPEYVLRLFSSLLKMYFCFEIYSEKKTKKKRVHAFKAYFHYKNKLFVSFI